jgi:ABC-type transport system involved in multi-copper enzyme maturation permease subunit
MFWNLFRFELNYWLRAMMVWVFFFVIGAMFFAASSTDQIVVGAAVQNTYRNAPFVIQTFYSMVGLFTMLMTVAFSNSAAARDFQYNTHQMLFATPIRKGPFLLGRFWGSAIVSIVPMLGISVAVILAGFMPWIDPDRWRSIAWDAHAMSILTFAIPNTLFISAVGFAIAALTRSTVTAFLGMLVLLVGYAVSDVLTQDLDNERIAALLDPFAIRTFAYMTKYWTVAERNQKVLGWEGLMLWNRLLWLGVGALIFAFTYQRFRFAERARKGKAVEEAPAPSAATTVPVWNAATRRNAFTELMGMLRFEFWGLVKTTSFIVLASAALLNAVPAIIFSAREGYGNSTYPVTYFIVEVIQGSLYLFMISMITYYAGLLVWRERDARMDEIEDVTPSASWTRYAAKFLALMGVLAILQALMVLVGATVQGFLGYHRYQFDLYFTELFVYDFSVFVFLAVLAFLVHVASPNKYVGYFAYIIFLAVNAFIWDPLNISSRLVRYASRPGYTYSDFYGYAPYLTNWWSFTCYWALFAALLVTVSIALWPRGKETSLARRARGWRGGLRVASAGLALCFAAMGAWMYYNTAILNVNIGPKTRLDRQAEYEKKYKKHQAMVLPRITMIRYDIDVVPERRALRMRAEQRIVNKSSTPISEVPVSLDARFDYEIDIPGTKIKMEDKDLQYRMYEFNPPLQLGEERRMRYTVSYEPKGVQNGTAVPEITQNGTFFNNGIAPQIGYQPDGEITDRNERKKRGLPEKELMPKLERDCTVNCMNSYLSNHSDWVSVESVVSTAPDQIAIAPGSLVKEWSANGRRYFQYKVDKDSLNFYSFMSARYRVERKEVDGVKLEVYYHPEHTWNVPKMMSAIERSLAYYKKNFGPYLHKQARIIEFPRVAGFAQAFPGTMPYSESIGFVARLDKPDDIDMVNYVVAHEIGHQWWAHQVCGANMQGATALSEMLAQYSALMVMEHQYGRDLMRKFMEYEVDRYLSARGRERLKERPLLTVEAQQGYIHYQKASAAIYYLKEMIGEEAVNRALRKVIAKYAYAEPPYPTSHVLIDAFREETPENLRYLIKDLFEDITLFANRTLEAKAKKRADGKFEVTIDVESKKFKADEKGNETEVAMADFVEIGAWAKPEDGKRYGKVLHRERVEMKSGKRTFTFVVDQLPEKAGIDPLRLLIDRVPDDNMKKVDVGS